MTHSVKMVRTGSIVQAGIKIKYFEVTILSFDGSICIGLASLGSSLGGLQFGIDNQGDLIQESRNQHNYYVGRPLEVGDTIGTGWDRKHKSLFFTFNGRQLDTVILWHIMMDDFVSIEYSRERVLFIGTQFSNLPLRTN